MAVSSIAEPWPLSSLPSCGEGGATCIADVMAIKRYLPDLTFHYTTGEIPFVDFPYAYDILLTDGEYKRKCLLSVHLNALVHKNVLRVGSTIEIMDTRFLKSPHSILLLCNILVVNQRDAALPDVPFWNGASHYERTDAPLVSSRGCYLSLWNSVDPSGQHWDRHSIQCLDRESSARFLAERLKMERLTSRDIGRVSVRGIVGRVVNKTRIVHFGKSRDLRNPFPFVFNFVLQDETASLPVVVWNELCVKLFKSIHVGDVVAVRRYKVKPRYQRSYSIVQRQFSELSQIQSQTSDTQTVQTATSNAFGNRLVEVSLMDSSVVCQIPLSICTALHLDFPSVVHTFVPFSDVHHMPDNIFLDVVGMIIFVGRWERSRRDVDVVTKTCPDLWSWRWVAVMDNSSRKSILLQLFACSLPMAWNALKPGKVLVCTQCRICSITSCSRGKPARTVFLTTTCDSQMYVTSASVGAMGRGQFCHSRSFADVMQWSMSDNGKKCLDYACIDGSFSFPSLPTTLKDLEDYVEILKVTPIDAIPAVLDELHYRERRTLVISGTIVEIKLVILEQRKDRMERRNGVDVKLSKERESQERKVTDRNSGMASSCDGRVEKSEDEGDSNCKRQRLMNTDSEDSSDSDSSLGVSAQWTSTATNHSMSDTILGSEHVVDDTFPKPVASAIKSNYYWVIRIRGIADSVALNSVILPKWLEMEPWRSYSWLDSNNASDDVNLIAMLSSGLSQSAPETIADVTDEHIQNICSQFDGRPFIFVVNVFCCGNNDVEIVLKRAFLA